MLNMPSVTSQKSQSGISFVSIIVHLRNKFYKRRHTSRFLSPRASRNIPSLVSSLPSVSPPGRRLCSQLSRAYPFYAQFRRWRCTSWHPPAHIGRTRCAAECGEDKYQDCDCDDNCNKRQADVIGGNFPFRFHSCTCDQSPSRKPGWSSGLFGMAVLIAILLSCAIVGFCKIMVTMGTGVMAPNLT